MKQICLFLLVLAMIISDVRSQTTDLVILGASERRRFKQLIEEDELAKHLYDSVAILAGRSLNDKPRPLNVLFYEGLLDTNPDRIKTVESLGDIDKIVNLVYASFGTKRNVYAQKARQMVLAWANTYVPTGNTINENKLVPVFWAYHIFENEFSPYEKKVVEQWMIAIANGQIKRVRTPNNNWEAKRLKIIGTVGCITARKEMMLYSIRGLKEYINTAYYADGTSNDLRQRDALHYHISGLIPTIAIFINCSLFDSGFELFDYVAPSGSSIRKSVEYTIPYATGEVKRREWQNSKVLLDKKRAEAGIARYQPGVLFEPRDAVPMFEWACYYNADWYSFFGQERRPTTWISLLNSHHVRRKTTRN